ncbi:MAG: thiamine pyrophosphate-dependent enzyme, partial [Calditrichaceae bacterium]
MQKLEFLNNAHPEYIEKLFNDYKQDPDSVDESWRAFFQGYELALEAPPESSTAKKILDETHRKENYVINLINSYRMRGHLFTKTNPVRNRRTYKPDLNIYQFGLTDDDLEKKFQAGNEIGIGSAKLNTIIEHLNDVYCKSIGFEYKFIRKPDQVDWLENKIEPNRNQPDFDIKKKRMILQKLNQAVVFENFLHSKFVGQKRFSLQGGETLIPGLQAILDHGSEMGMEEFMIGMPHRGRLNVLTNILNKEHEEIFAEFEGEEYADSIFAGDVKYHLGFSSQVETSGGKQVMVGLAPNPSHLEAVNPVIEGIVRAKIDNYYKNDHDKILPILIHGDAA